MADRARFVLKAQLDQARNWLVHCTEQVGVMLSSKDNASKSQDQTNNPMDLVSNFESLLVDFQMLLIWSNPLNSAISLTMFTCLYWLVVLWSPRLFSIIAVLVFCYHFYEMWTRYVWPEIRVPTVEIKESWTSINPDVLSAPEIQTYLTKLKSLVAMVFGEIADLRRRSHGTFCFLSVSFLMIFYYLGKSIPGVVLVYSLAVLLFLAPGLLLYVLPNHILEAAVEYCNSMASAKSEEVDQQQLETNDLPEQNEPVRKDSTPDCSSHESSSPSHFNSSHFDDNFFANENAKSNSDSTSDIDDFEVISETDLGEIELK